MSEPDILGAAVTLGDFMCNNLLSAYVRKGAPNCAEYFGVDEPPDPALVAPWELDPEHFWSEDGVRRLVRRLTSRGVNRIYLRTFGGGDPLYPSRHVRSRKLRHVHEVFKRHLDLPDGYGDHSRLDCMTPAVDEAHKQGAEIFAWYTGCEDDHGASGVVGQFAEAHPEFLQENRFGEKLPGNLSFAFPEVIAYKRRLIEEFMDFGFDGLLLDCTRECGGFSTWKVEHPVVRNGQRRVPTGGYEKPVREAFIREIGSDPRNFIEGSDGFELFWTFRLRYYPTPLVRLCGELAHARGLTAEVMIRPKENVETYGLDFEQWIDEGLVDALLPVMPGHFYPGATHGYYLDDAGPLAGMFQLLQLQVRDRVPVRWLNYLYPVSAMLGYYGKVNHPARGIPATPPPGPLRDLLQGRRETARALRADGFVIFEADHAEACSLWEAIGEG